MVLRVKQVLEASKERRVISVQMVNKVNKVQLDIVEKGAFRVLMERVGLMVKLVLRVKKVQLAKMALEVKQGNVVLMARLVQLVHREFKVFRVQQGSREPLVMREFVEPLEQEVLMVLLDQLDKMVLREKQVLLEQRVPLEKMVKWVIQGNVVSKVPRVKLVQMENKVQLVLRERLVKEV
jgi:hypothetical protein